MGAWRRHTCAHGRQLSLFIGRRGGSYMWTVTGPGAEGAGEERLSGLGFPLTLWVEVSRGKLLKERKHGSFPCWGGGRSVLALETGEGEVCLSVSGAGERPVLGPVGVGTTG